MKKAHILEILIILIASFGGVSIVEIKPELLGIIIGFLIFSFDSYLVGELKKQVINEVLEIQGKKKRLK